MEKKIIVKDLHQKDHECCGGEHHHKHGGGRQRHVRIHRPEHKKVTKLITSKEELVEYVNELGEQGHHIDIFTIEDGLYKVVVKYVIQHNEEIEIEVE